MNPARPGSCIHVPIYIDSSDDEASTVTFQTAVSAVHGVVNQEALEYVEGVVNSYANATITFKTGADNGDYGETVPIQTNQVPFVIDLTSNEDMAERASPRLSTGRRGCSMNMPNEPLGSQVQADDARLPEHASTGGLRRSMRKRNEVYYYEGPIRFPRKLPRFRNACEKPRKSGSPKKKFTCLKIRASNYPF